jgi:hypothetical protein
MKQPTLPNRTIPLTKWLTSLAAFAALTASGEVYGQTWQTALDYQFIAGASSGGNCITADGLGNVFTGGVGYPPSGYGSGLVLKTDTTEANWYLIDDSNPSPPQDGSEVNGLAFDSSGNLYSTGTLYYPCSKTSCPGSFWYIRKSPDAGTTWNTVNLFQYAAGKSCGAGSVAADLSGNVYVVGAAPDASGVSHWLVRRGSNGGQSWASVDDIGGARAYGIGFVPNVGLFAVGAVTAVTSGKGKSSTSTTSWVVRRSMDGGASWVTVDQLQPPVGYSAYPFGICSDGQGNIYVAGRTTVLVGSGRTATTIAQWLVRKSADGGNAWATVDAFSYAPGKSSVAFGAGTDSAGNSVVAGTATDGLGSNHWLVRRAVQGVWQTIDDYQLAPGETAGGNDIVADAAGNLLVTGFANDAAGVMHWIVRRTNP